MTNAIIGYLKDKIRNMSTDDAIKYAKQAYTLYSLLYGIRGKDKIVDNFLNDVKNNNISSTISNNFGINIDQLKFLDFLKENNVNQIYSSLNPDQQRIMDGSIGLIRIILKNPNFNFKNSNNSFSSFSSNMPNSSVEPGDINNYYDNDNDNDDDDDQPPQGGKSKRRKSKKSKKSKKSRKSKKSKKSRKSRKFRKSKK
jgi:hypothetical protein